MVCTVQGELFNDVGRYQRLFGKLINLTITHPDMTYVASVVVNIRTIHNNLIMKLLSYPELSKECSKMRTVRLLVLLINGPLLPIVPLLEVILLPGAVKSKFHHPF
jgi:hypothetical protein